MILGDIEEQLKGKSKVEYIFIWAAASEGFWNLMHLKYNINQTAFSAALRSGETVYCLL